MKLKLAAKDEAFQSEIRAFLADYWEAGTHLVPGPRLWRAQRSYTAALAERGWIAGHWPLRQGGAGWSGTQRLLWERCVASACAPQLSSQGVDVLGPLIARVGSSAQRALHLPAIAHGEVAWSQAFVEDAQELDLNQIMCRATPGLGQQGNQWRLDGIKSWVLDMPPAELEQASWFYVLADTSLGTASGGQSGGQTATGTPSLGLFLVPATSPGVSITPRPMIGDSGGQPMVHSVAFDAVQLDADALLGAPDEGVSYVQEIERSRLARPGMIARNYILFNELRDFVESDPLWQDADFRARLHEVEVELAALTALESRAWFDEGSGEQPRQPREALQLGLAARIEPLNQKLADLQVDALGYFAMPFVDFSALDNEGSIGPEFAQPALLGMLSDRARAAVAAPREHLKDMIAKTVLALGDSSKAG